MPRTAGGYGLGGSARYFSHTPAAPAQVVQSVSQAMRAFFLSGQKIKYDGVGARGNPQYRAVSKLEDEVSRTLANVTRSAPGAFVDFRLNPTITALDPLAAAAVRSSSSSVCDNEYPVLPTTLGTKGFLDVLSVDFGRALHDLTAVHADLQRLSALGDLLVVQEKGTLRVRFPGVDACTVERLCDEVGVQRGLVGQDDGFDAAIGASVVLKLPFAPDSEVAASSPGGSARSLQGDESEDGSSLSDDDSFLHEAFAAEMDQSPWRFLEECGRGRSSLG